MSPHIVKLIALNKSRIIHGEGAGKNVTKEYISWRRMKDRCYNPGATGYEHYGGRGIRVCNRWRSSYVNFLADMGRKPEGNRICLDRIDPNGNYEPKNCRWVTMAENNRNKRCHHV